MSLGSRIKEKREMLNMSRSELAEKIGVTPSAIGNYETEVSTPKVELLYKIFDALECDPNYLYQDEMRTIQESNRITAEEHEMIRKFRRIDEHDKRTILFILNEAYERSQQPQLRVYTYMRKIAAAGNGFCIDDIPVETIEAPELPGADFIIGVNGDSMEPTFEDGDLVYVKRTNSINKGDIGIFIVNGECYIKELGINGLISHNENYEMIPGNEYIRCVGLVLGKVS